MKKRVVLVVSLIIIFLMSIPAYGITITTKKQDLRIDQKELDRYVSQLFEKEMKNKHIPGAAIVITQGNKVLLSKGFGYSNLETMEKVNPDTTVFRIGSVSKLFVADIAMQLEEEGRLKFNEDINTYLKTLEVNNDYNVPITMHQLLTHTSGLDDHRIGDLSKNRKEIEPLSKFLEENLLPVIRKPGRAIQYNSYGIALAGAVIEGITNQTYADYLIENVFQPLGMNNTSMLAQVENLSKSYQYMDGEYKLYPSFGYFNIYPAGGVLSTAADMGKYMILHLNNGKYNNKQILSRQSIERIHTQQETFDPLLTGMGYVYWIREHNNYRLLEHGGYGLGYLSDLCLIPEYNMGIFITINQGNNNFPEEAARAIIDRFLPEKDMTIKPKDNKSDNWIDIKSFIGYYRFLEMTQTTFDKCSVFPYGKDYNIVMDANGKLALEEKGYYYAEQKTYPLERIDNMVFKNLEKEQIIVFKKDLELNTVYMAESETSFHGTYLRLKWYEKPVFQLVIFILTLGFFTITIITFLIMKLYSTIKVKIEKIETKYLNRLGNMSFIISFLNVGFIITSLYTFKAERLCYGVPFDVKALLVVPFIALFLTIVMLLYWINDERKGIKYGVRNIYYLLIILLSFTYIWFLKFWNLFGFKY